MNIHVKNTHLNLLGLACRPLRCFKNLFGFKNLIWPIALCAIILSRFVHAETLQIEETITGNQQHPNVLFIVPWQTPSAAIPPARNMAIRLPDYLTQPVERIEFLQQISSLPAPVTSATD